jgi:hypothetical protein
VPHQAALEIDKNIEIGEQIFHVTFERDLIAFRAFARFENRPPDNPLTALAAVTGPAAVK